MECLLACCWQTTQPLGLKVKPAAQAEEKLVLPLRWASPLNPLNTLPPHKKIQPAAAFNYSHIINGPNININKYICIYIYVQRILGKLTWLKAFLGHISLSAICQATLTLLSPAPYQRTYRTCLHIVSFMSNYWPAPGILKCLCVFMTEMCNW